jgi:hypothetical protein
VERNMNQASSTTPSDNSNLRLVVLTSGALLLGLALGAASATAFSHSEVHTVPAPRASAWSAEHAAIRDDGRGEAAPTF